MRLGTDRIDLLQTHWQDETTPIAETMGVPMELKQEGKIRAIGVSNANSLQMAEYQAAGSLDTDQEKYSMLVRGIEGDQLRHCEKNGIAMLAYSPLAQGLLTGKMGADRKFASSDLRATRPMYSVENRMRVAAMLAKLQPIADGHGVPLAHVVIAWTLQQPGLTHVLCGARTAAQAKENAAAGDLDLPEAELKVIDGAIADYDAASAG